MLDPRLLRSFVTLADELHFGRAAERLHMAQPALTQQLHRLEKQLGCELLERSTRVVGLTTAGRAMLEPARLAVRAADQAERAVREAGAASPSLRVGVDVYLDDVIGSLTAYASEHTEVSIWISRVPEMQGQEMLAEGHLDAFVGFTPPAPSGRRSRVRAVEVPIMVMVSPEHPLTSAPRVDRAALRQHTIAIARQDQAPERFIYWVELLSEGAGREALTLREVGPPGPVGLAALTALVTAGEAVAFGPPATLSKLADGLRILPFDPPLSVPTYVSWNPGLSPLVDGFVDLYGAVHVGSPDLVELVVDPGGELGDR